MKGNIGKENHVVFSHNRDDWRTPQKLFDDLNKEFNFALDAAASEENAKCFAYYSQLDRTLRLNWCERSHNLPIWLNPPYSMNTEFIEKAFHESENGVTVVCLVPSRTDTEWWHEFVMKAAEIRFLRGRLYFDDAVWPAPFPSSIIVFRNHESEYPKLSMIDGRKYRNYSNDKRQTKMLEEKEMITLIKFWEDQTEADK